MLNGHVFNELTSLNWPLILVSNRIELIETGAFRNLINLEIIDLSENRLYKIEKHSFQNLTSLYF